MNTARESPSGLIRLQISRISSVVVNSSRCIVSYTHIPALVTLRKKGDYLSIMSAPVSLKDLTIENITENVHAINSQCSNPRLKYILERTVTHLHELAREVRLTTDEWMIALQFLTKVGQISSDTRQVRMVQS